ncbi:diguanylate cyclase [Marinospirillum perlucidum]|uniref:diguanylate cyclase n=1 Tax=Marinospirillum perlucidum TaxID=1982602 RepID=UPI000DF2841C|nr:transporter substrate-binding domain-containing protein [Marinospirillum perlucidum]
MSRPRAVIFTLLLVLLGLVVTAPLQAADKITLQLKWLHQFQFAGYYAALERGYFADEGLEVTLVERDPSKNNIHQVLNGEADYGVADSVLFLYQDQDQGVVLVAPIFQHSPNVLMTLASSGIETPQDLVGKKLAFYENDSDGIGLLAMLAEQGVLQEGLIRAPWNERLNRLLSGQVDAVAAYNTNEPHRLRELGYEVRLLDPKHYGQDFYGDILFTHAREARENPHRVEAMRRAVIKGWEYALDNKAEMVELIYQKYNTQGKSRNALMQEAYGLEPLISRHTLPLGQLDRGRLEYILDQLNRHDLVEETAQGARGLVFTSGPQIDLNPEERDFLRGLEQLRVAVDPDWPPFEYYDSEQRLQGISSDYLDLLERRLGISIELVKGLTWPQVLEAIRAKEVDLLPAVTSTPERRRYLNFTDPLVRSPMVMVTRDSMGYLASMDHLRDLEVMVVKDYVSDELLSQDTLDLNLLRVASAEEALQRVASGEGDVFVGNLAVVSNLIKTQGLANLKISGQAPYSFDLSMAVRDDWPLMVSIVEKALASISPEEHTRIYNRWVNAGGDEGLPWRRILPGAAALLSLLLLLGIYSLHLVKLNRKIQRVNQQLTFTEAELREKNAELEHLSITDKLTGCYNRHYLDRVLEEQLTFAQRYQRPLSLILFDLDFFKRVNDEQGHQVGDLVLTTFADLVAQRIRSSDVFGRWGGEEFLLICPETDLQQAAQVAEKIRKATAMEYFFQGIHQTVSAGVVCNQGYASPDQLLSATDQLLYEAKAAGRNRVVARLREAQPSAEISD